VNDNLNSRIILTNDDAEIGETEKALRESELRYRLAVEAANEFIWDWNILTNEVTRNEGIQKLFGYSDDQMDVDASWGQDKLHPEDHNRVLQLLQSAIEGDKEFWQDEYRVRRADGSYADVLSRGRILRDAAGKAVRMVGAMMDMSQRRQAERALRESEERLRLATQTGKVGIWDWNIPANRILWSEALFQIYGVTQDEFDGTVESFAALIHPEDREFVLQSIQETLRGETPYDVEFRALRPNGEIIWLFTSARVLRDGQAAVRMLGATMDITERKFAERALLENEERFAKAFNASPISLTISSLKDGRLVEVNETFVKTTGYAREEAIGKTTIELGLWAKPQDRDEELNLVRQFQRVREAEYTFRMRDGREVIGLLSAEHIEIGGESYALTVIQDITERKKAQRAQTLLGAIIESSDDAIISKDLNGMIMSWNRGAERLFGYLEQEVIGKSITILIPSERYEEEVEILRRLRQGERIEHYETLRLTKDGRWVNVSLTISPIRDDKGQIIGASKIARDITERKQIETTVQKQSERLRLMWEAASVLLTTEEPDKMLRGLFHKIALHFGLDTYFNFMVNHTGDALQLESCIGIPEEVAQTITRLEFGQAVCGNVALRGAPITATFIQESDDSMTQLVNSFGIRAYTCNPLMADGRLLGTLSFASRTRDQFEADELEFLRTITHYVTVAYERLRLVRELKDNDRRKDEFLATLAHELRNPLAPLRNGLQILRLAEDNPDTVEQARAMMDRQVQQMVRLIDDLLDLSRISQGKIDLRKERVNLSVILENAIEISRPLIEQSGHRFTCNLPLEPVFVDADVTRLAQVFANLLNNAAKYTRKEGRIQLNVRQQGSEVVVSVKDNGIGIPVFMLTKVFEMFIQVNPSGVSQDGLGIGLSIARRLVEMHGGTIEAHSEGNGAGSEFIVRLPTLLPATARRQAPNAESEKDKASAGWRILVADDNEDSAASMAILMKMLGNDVRTASDGLSAVKEAALFRPDVILMDIGMPEMDGYEACRHIREQPWGREIVIIALTGWGQEEDRRQSQEAGFTHHLVKPVDLSALERLLAQLPPKIA
jgi:PAS domain S-box-containing protein